MRYLVIIFLLGGLLLGCSSTAVKSFTPAPAISEPPPKPVMEKTGYDASDFVDDVTIPDNMTIARGKKFLKTWRLRNSGTNAWENYKLAFTDGDLLGAPKSVPVKNTPPGEEVDISVPMQAPDTPGFYTGYWKMSDDKGTLFGVGIWVMIEVK